MERILLNKAGQKIILLGNEAIARGALEAGVQFVSTYPGTPASEIGDTFNKIQNSKFKIQNLYFEYSTNEKVALEAAVGASFCGLRTLVAMKHFGLNVCSDSLMPFLYMGCKGPTVIVVGDDPSCHSSAQSEQNSRAYSFLAHIPTLEPSDPQECKDFVKLAFKISEKFKIPVLIRTTTRVAHQRAPVLFQKLNMVKQGPVTFVKDDSQFITMPPRVLGMKKELLDKIEKIKEFSEKSKINSIITFRSVTSQKTFAKEVGIITSGISYLYVIEGLKELNLNLPVLKLGFFYPLPEKKVKKFIKKLKKVLIVEELEPYLEKEIAKFAKDANPKLQVFGKNFLPEVGELNPDIVTLVIAKVTNTKYKIAAKREKIRISKRFPRLCSGCPYWLVFTAVKRALRESKIKRKDIIFGGDIGCYMLAGFSPIELQDYLSCMGSSIGIGHGLKKVTSQKLIAFIGDSTFFHAGIPPLINAVFNESDPLIIIMNNQTTAMTGHQPYPGKIIKIEEIVKACGVKNLKVIDPVNQKEMVKTIREFLKKKEVSVIVARRPCKFIK